MTVREDSATREEEGERTPYRMNVCVFVASLVSLASYIEKH